MGSSIAWFSAQVRRTAGLARVFRLYVLMTMIKASFKCYMNASSSTYKIRCLYYVSKWNPLSHEFVVQIWICTTEGLCSYIFFFIFFIYLFCFFSFINWPHFNTKGFPSIIFILSLIRSESSFNITGRWFLLTVKGMTSAFGIQDSLLKCHIRFLSFRTNIPKICFEQGYTHGN